jgi:hypothetical protein
MIARWPRYNEIRILAFRFQSLGGLGSRASSGKAERTFVVAQVDSFIHRAARDACGCCAHFVCAQW